MHLSLAVKALDGTPVRPRPITPGMLQRSNHTDLDPGRPWAGDLYETGAPTDPEEAYARFTGEDVDDEDVEAWVDKTDDGTLTGWVRQGLRVWRYTDPAAWALDVDGAGMKRAGGEASTENTDDNPDDDANDVVEDAPRPSEDEVRSTLFAKNETKSLRLVVHPKA